MEYCTVESAALLSAAEEIELAQRIEVGLYAHRLHERGGHPDATTTQLDRLVADGESAAERFLMANVRLVSAVSRPTARATGVSEPDLFQEGFAALVSALYRFDHRMGKRFVSYAMPWIRSGVADAVHRQRTVPTPPTDRAQIRKHWWRLTQTLRREPVPAEVAALLGVSAAQVVRAMTDVGALLFDELSGHEPADPVAQQRLDAVLDHPAPVQEWLDALPRLEARVLWLRFGFTGEIVGYTEAGRLLQLSASRVRRMEQRALDRLRDICHTDDLPATG